MKIKFLNNTIEILQSEKPIPYPFYDVNYAYKSILISAHISLIDNADKQLLNELILRGCIDIITHYYVGLNNTQNPIMDYVVSKLNVLDEVYIIENEEKVYPFKEE